MILFYSINFVAPPNEGLDKEMLCQLRQISKMTTGIKDEVKLYSCESHGGRPKTQKRWWCARPSPTSCKVERRLQKQQKCKKKFRKGPDHCIRCMLRCHCRAMNC